MKEGKTGATGGIGGFIDIHNHVLPGLDDGAQSLDQALFMLRQAVSQGMTGLIATSHFKPDRYIRERELYEQQFQLLEETAGKEFPGFRFYRGNEIFFYQDVIKELQTGVCHTLAGTDYVLVEFSPVQQYPYIRTAAELLGEEGYRPVIAHAERYNALEEDMDRVWELRDLGALIQVNAGAVEKGGKRFGKTFIRRLLEEEAVHFLATDAHNETNWAFRLEPCLKNLRKWCSYSYIRRITWINQRKLLENQYIE